MKLKEIAMITSGFLPVPATKGGAVENLIVNLLDENEKNKTLNFQVFSVYDEKASNEALKYKYTKFKFIKINKFVKMIDKIVFMISKHVLKKQNSQSYRYIFQRLYFLNKCSKLLYVNDYDKVLLENHPTQYLALKWRKNYLKYNGRYYYHCHNEFASTYGCTKIIKATKKFICVSEFIANSISKYVDIPKMQCVVLRNCIDIERFSKDISKEEKDKIRKKYNINNDDKVLLFTGRIIPEKGVKELIQALKNVKYEHYKLLILGSALNEFKTKTEYQEEIENNVKLLSNKIIFTGFVKYEEINKFYSIANISVLPSAWNDPAPLTIIESLVCGLPIITTNSGGIPEYAKDGSAIIIKRDDNLIKELSKSIDELLNDDEKCLKMGKIGLFVSKDLRISNYYNNFIKIMNRS